MPQKPSSNNTLDCAQKARSTRVIPRSTSLVAWGDRSVMVNTCFHLRHACFYMCNACFYALCHMLLYVIINCTITMEAKCKSGLFLKKSRIF